MKYKKFKISIDTKSGIKPIGVDKFTLDFPSNNYKIYILKDGTIYIYVGTTKQGIGKRFGQGFRAYLNAENDNKGKDGYSGYKWIKKYNKLDLFIFDLGEDIMEEKHTEAIEAEIVYLIRNKYKKWPLSQNEIHFNNKYCDALEKATEIFNIIEEKQ